MAIELRKEVADFLRRTGLPPRKRLGECLLLLAMFYGSYGIGIFMAFIAGSPLWCLLLGPMITFMMVNVAHTAMHGRFSDSRRLNLLGQCLFDAGGYAASCWDVDHQSHHQAPHSSIDLQTAPATGMRFFEHQPSRWFHRHQMIYLWLILAVYAPSSWITHSYCTLFKYPGRPVEKVLHVGFKLIFFVLPIASTFVRFDLAHALGNFILFAVSMSYSTVFMLFIQHGDSYLPEDQSDHWSVRQVTTSVSWRSKSRTFDWLFGYFNHHTEHHLFPGLNPALYPKIQPIVKTICAKYGVRYKDVSYAELVGSQLGAWRAYAAGRYPTREAVG
jgi:fatty acid desaturase